MNSASAQDTFTLAVERHQAGNLVEAQRLYALLLQQSPENPVVLHMLGLALWQSGNPFEAEEHLRRAIAADPMQAEYYGSLGLVLKSRNKLEQAVAAYEQALSLKPQSPKVHGNLGMAFHAMGKLDRAIASYQQALQLKPDWQQVVNNLGSALHALGAMDQAIAAYRRAAELVPTDPAPHRNLARAMRQTNQFEQAVRHGRAAIALDPTRADDYNTLGAAYHGLCKLDEAAEAYRHCLARDPKRADTLCNLAAVYKDTGAVRQAIEHFRRAMEMDPNQADLHSNLVYTLHFDPDYDAQAILREHKIWNQRHAAPLGRKNRPHENVRDPGKRLRIGYVSPDLCGHVVGWNLLPLLSKHDHQQFEVFCYSAVGAPDEATKLLRSHCQGWRNICYIGDEQAAEIIRADKIDILVDLSLHMARNRLLAFARKPAPVQVTYLGYCSTTGLETMDYRLSDPHLDPPDVDLSCYTEKTVRLPVSYWCYQPSGPAPAIAEAPAMKNGYITFGCLNNFSKVSADAMRLWGKVLEATPGSRLLVQCPQSSHRSRVVEQFASAGVPAERLELVGSQSWPDYIRTYQRIDVALDPFPYGGGITTCDALWMGVPLVTLSGQTAVGRGGRSIMSNVGLPELVAYSPHEYVSLASQAHKWIALRPTLRDRMIASPLMDAARFARDVEAAYRGMWRAWTGAP